MSRKALTTPAKHADGRVTFQDVAQQFLTSRRVLGLSPTSIRSYADVLHYLETHGFPTRLDTLTVDDIEKYIAYLLDGGMKPVTVNGKLRTLKAMLGYAFTRGILPNNPMRRVKFLRHERTIIKAFDRTQIRKIIQTCDDGTFVGVREAALVYMMLDTGCRISELLGLRMGDIDAPHHRATVMGKGRKPRVVYYTHMTANALESYLENRGTLPHDIVFVSETNAPAKVRTVQDRLHDVGIRAGITGVRMSPHTFRHTFAKMYIQNGGDIFTLQKMLGHTTLDMVRKYVEMFGDDVSEAHAKYSPVDSL